MEDDAGTDAALVARVRAGDREAFGVLFDRYAQTVHRYAVRRLAGASDRLVVAEDVMSMVFLQVWAGRRRIVVVDGSVRPWLLGVAGNVLRNEVRSRRRHRAALARYAATQPGAQPDPTPEVGERLDRESDFARALGALSELSERERAVADLCLIEGLPVATAARALGLPEGTVRSRLHRARTHLRALLRSDDPADTVVRSGHHQVGRAPRVPVDGSSPA